MRHAHSNGGRFPQTLDPPGHTILLIDDQPLVLSALDRVFRHEHYRILSAADGRTALDILARERCDLIIADYLMPGMSGIELVRRVKEGWPEVFCILLTGHADLAVLSSGVREGLLCKFALKPWNDNDLRTSVADALATTRLPTASAWTGVRT